MPGPDDRAWMPPSAAAREQVVETLAGYVDLIEVARGGDSIVYRARQVRPDRDVAVKVLLVDDEAALRRFERELEITVRLGREHPNIVTVLDTGTAGSGRPCIVMDFYEQGSLHDRLREVGPASVNETVAVGTVLADALAFAHERGVLHRDVKPQNVLLLPTSYVLTDFGVARLADSEHTGSADRFSYRHASPQMLDGMPATAADDVWSVGSTMFTLLDGRPPFASDEPGDDTALAYLRRVRTELPRPLTRPDVPPALREVIARCLEKDPDRRWPSAAALREALVAIPTEARSWDPDRPVDRPTPPPAVDPVPGPVSVWAPAADLPDVPAPGAQPETFPVAPVPTAAPAVPAVPDHGAAHAASALAHESAHEVADAEPTGHVPGADPSSLPEVDAPRGRNRRVVLFVAAALLLGVALGGIGFVISSRRDDAKPTAQPTSDANPILPVDSASAVPPPTGPVITDPDLTPQIDDLRSRGSSIYLHWTDPSGGTATFLVVRSDPAGNYWTGRLDGKGTSGTLESWGPVTKRPCFVVVAIAGEKRAVSAPRCVTI